MALANKVVFPFMGSVNFSMTAAAVVFNTPGAFSHKLGVLQAIQYKTAVFKAMAVTDGAVTVRLKEGANVVSTMVLTGNASNSVDVDLGGISGAAQLTVEVEVTTVGTGTGDVYAFLDVEQPLQVSTC